MTRTMCACPCAVSADTNRRYPSPGSTWTRSSSQFDAASADVNAGGLTDEQVDDLATKESDAAQAVMALPSRTIADAATKLRIQMKLNLLVEAKDLTGILADLDRLGRETIEIGPENPEVVRSFATFRDTLAALKALPVDRCEHLEQHYYGIMDRTELVLMDTPASTPAGISMRLKSALVGLVPDAWSDHAVSDERPPEFEQGRASSDLYHQMVWSVIEDLDRIAGVNPSEQGA